MKKHLLEAATLVEADTEAETWKVRLINEGRGSSGVYSAQLLEDYGHAFNGAISFLNHPQSGPETRNFTEIAGRVQGEVWKEKAEDGTLGLYANWRPDDDHRAKLERYKDKLGLSIYISGSGEVEDDGEFHVREFDVEDPFKSVDVVIAAGRGGRFEITESYRQIYESARVADTKKTTTTAVEENGNEMENEKVVEAVEALTAQIALLVADKENTKATEAQVQADADAVKTAVEAYDAAVKAVDEADLLQPQRESLLEAAKRGEDITSAIVSAKAVKEAAVEAARSADAEDHGRDFGARKVESATELGKVFG